MVRDLAKTQAEIPARFALKNHRQQTGARAHCRYEYAWLEKPAICPQTKGREATLFSFHRMIGSGGPLITLPVIRVVVSG